MDPGMLMQERASRGAGAGRATVGQGASLGADVRSSPGTSSSRLAAGTEQELQHSVFAAGVGTQAVPVRVGPLRSLARYSSSEIIVPPLNFDMVAPGVYRSGHPNERNFSFLKRLNLKSIIYLANDDYRENVVRWAQKEGIRIFHHRVTMNKEPFTEMDEQEVASAVAHVLDERNLPVLVHCNKGKYRVGCLVGCIRRLQRWSHISILEEYSRFAGEKMADEEFIEMFDLTQVKLDPTHSPAWL